MQAALFAAFVLSLITAFSPLSAQKTDSGPHQKPEDPEIRDTIALKSAHPDSLRKRLVSVRNDSIQLHAWRSLKDIAPAVAIAPLDGPDDIFEKIEIIQDRMDALLTEKKKLVIIVELLTTGRQSQEAQIEVLEDLSEINRTSDMQLQQRLHDLQQQSNILSRRIRAYKRSLTDLKNEYAGLENLSKRYQKQAQKLQKDEDPNR